MIRGWFLPPSIISNEEVVVEINVNTALINQNIKREVWNCQKNFLNLTIKKKMETDKIHERVIEIQNNIQTSSPEQQTAMMNELINMVSKIEQSLSDIKLDIDDIENQIQTNEE